jgi:hypothetical protein
MIEVILILVLVWMILMFIADVRSPDDTEEDE